MTESILDEALYPTLGVRLVLVAKPIADDPCPSEYTVELRRGGVRHVKWRCETDGAREFFGSVRSTMDVLEALEKIRKASH